MRLEKKEREKERIKEGLFEKIKLLVSMWDLSLEATEGKLRN